MGLLENEAFLLELTRFFQKSRSKGSGAVRITMKRYDGRTKPVPRKPNLKKMKKGKKPPPKASASASSVQESHHPTEFTCLFHAKLGNSKASTIVHQKDVNKFQLAYCSVIKGNMDAFKKIRKKPGTGAAISQRESPKKT